MILAVSCVLQRLKYTVCCPGQFALVETSMILLGNTVSQRFVSTQGHRVNGLCLVCTICVQLYEEEDVSLGSTHLFAISITTTIATCGNNP